jgi:choline dehydrogenase
MDFDYVIVGGGAVGRVVAAEVAGDGGTVLLLDPPGAVEGSYQRGSRQDFDMWNLDGWRWSDVVPHFEALEKRFELRREPPTEMSEACLRSAEDAGLRRKEDLDDGDLSGVVAWRTTHLAPQPGRATVLHAAAHRVQFEGTTATSVEIAHEGRMRVVRARREVILCAGAVETARLLLRSGVGDASELRAQGIPVIADVPAVGRNFMDQPQVVPLFLGRRRIGREVPTLLGFQRANHASLLPAGASDTRWDFLAARDLHWMPRKIANLPLVTDLVDRVYGIAVTLGKPHSRGQVTLRSVDPNRFAERDDLDTLMAGIRRARQLTAGLAEWGSFELRPGRSGDLETFALANVTASPDSGGTCRMGSDSSSVVDTRLRVRGVERLRVADASVMPFLPVSAPRGAAMMIGLRAARFIAEEQQKVQRA